MTRQIKIYRFNPAEDIEGEFKDYTIPDGDGWSVMDALDYIYENLDSSLSYYSHSRCLHGICARCAVKVNGKNVLSCEHPLPDSALVYIAPVSKDKVIKDLISGKNKSASPEKVIKKTEKRILDFKPDHFMVFVRDLERAASLYRDLLGFETIYGGRNEAVGYHNYLIRFGLPYIELLAFTDWEQGLAGGLVKPGFAELFDRRNALALGYCMETNDIETLSEQIKGGDLKEVMGPLPMERNRPDGKVLKWELCLPSGMTFQRLGRPFFVKWLTSSEERLALDPPANHPNRTNGLVGLSIGVADLNKVRSLYEQGFGFNPGEESEAIEFSALRTRYQLGGFYVDLLSPTGPGILKDHIDSLGEGPFQIVFESKEIDRTRAFIEGNGIFVEEAPDYPGGFLVDDTDRFGLRLVFTAQPT